MTTTQPKLPSREPLNLDEATVASFGDEWSCFDQSRVGEGELGRLFEQYFQKFPWDQLPQQPEGFDMGCGSGRWAKLVAPRVARLNCIDASSAALEVSRNALASFANVAFFHATANDTPLRSGSQDFGYSLGVLHHVPDTEGALKACVDLLKSGAPFLLYLYYRFDNRPLWFRIIWQASDIVRAIISCIPYWLKPIVTDLIALTVYYPLARISWLGERLGMKTNCLPLHFYRDKSFYTMRTDSRDRFGTPLEQRFTRHEIEEMMKRSGLTDVVFSEEEPYWCAVGRKK